MTRDPVCRMKVDPARAAARAEHAGEVYYFCSAGCQRTFLTDPGRFVAPAATASETKPREKESR